MLHETISRQRFVSGTDLGGKMGCRRHRTRLLCYLTECLPSNSIYVRSPTGLPCLRVYPGGGRDWCRPEQRRQSGGRQSPRPEGARPTQIPNLLTVAHATMPEIIELALIAHRSENLRGLPGLPIRLIPLKSSRQGPSGAANWFVGLTRPAEMPRWRGSLVTIPALWLLCYGECRLIW